MNFQRSYQGYGDYLATMYLMNRYLDMRLGREQHRNSQRNTRENNGMHDPLLYMAMGYMAAQSKDPVAGLALFSYLVDNKPSNHPGARRNFESRLERRIVLHGPIHYNLRQNPNYMNR